MTWQMDSVLNKQQNNSPPLNLALQNDDLLQLFVEFLETDESFDLRAELLTNTLRAAIARVALDRERRRGG